jgi:hypothetical protein
VRAGISDQLQTFIGALLAILLLAGSCSPHASADTLVCDARVDAHGELWLDSCDWYTDTDTDGERQTP